MNLRLVAKCAFLSFVFACSAQDSLPHGELRRYIEFAMGHDGIVARGKELFNNDQKTMCARCHTVDGTSSKVGPDLAFVGDKFPRRELITAIVEPSATIAVGYGATTIVTKSDEEYTGIIKQSTEAYVRIMGIDAKLVHIPISEIQAQHASDASFMPEGLQAGLSQQEFTDLIEYPQNA